MRVGDLAVRASFQVSFTSLPAAAQPGDIAPADAFRLLGLWHGPSISSAAATALFGTAEYLAEDALELLVDAHLLEAAESGRYKFHDLLRVYASERAVADLSGSDREAAVGRLLGWYMHAADAAAEVISPHRYKLQLQPDEADCPPPRFIGVDDALGWYDSERVNVVAATRQASACGLHEVAWRLPAPLFTMFNRRGNWTDCIATHRIALESARQGNNRQGEAWVLNNLGEALGFTRESEGIGYLEEALAIRREIGDRIGEGQTANNLADAYANLGRMDEALDLLARVLDLTREVGYRYGEGVALINMGEALLDLDRPQEAADRLLAARRTFTEINVPHGVAYALHNLGRSYLRLGHNADALDCLEQALVIHRAEGDRHREAFTLRFLGSAQARVGLVAEADESWRLAAAILDELGDTAQAAEVRTEQAVSGNSADSR